MFDMVSEKLIQILEESLLWMFESFISPFADLRLITTLIFGRDEDLSSVWGTFRPDELALALGPVYYTVMGLAGIVLISLIAVNGARVSSSGRNPQTRNVLTDFLKDLLFVGIVLLNLPLIYDLLFAINMNIVDLFSSVYDTEEVTRFSSSYEDMSGAAGSSIGTLGLIFVFLILTGLTLWANLYYLMRKVTLIILMALGPLMVVMWLVPQFKSLTGAWFRELTGSIFVQAVHAFVFFTIATVSSADSSFIGTVMVYVLFIPITESIRRLLSVGGDMQGGLAKTGAMFGMAGLAGMAGSIKGAMNDKSVMGAIQEAYKGGSGAMKGKSKTGEDTENGADSLKNTLGANPGSDIGSDTKAEKMLKTGDIFSKGGKAVMGMAGSVAGMGLGPVGAMAGATAGFAAGGALGGVTGRAGAALAQGAASRLEKGKEAASGVPKEGSEEFADAVADTETANWAKENKEFIMSDLKERFPNASPADLEKKFDGIQKEKRAGFYQGAQANFKEANSNAKNDALGKDLANSSALALADKWGENNQQDFFDQYDQEQPQKPGESRGNYQARRMNAFNDKKAEMRDKFHGAGIEALGDRGLDEPISKEAFLNKLAPAASKIAGVSHQDGYSNAIKDAIDDTQANSKKFAGKDLANASSTALTNSWAKQNKDSFMSDFEKENPKQANESESDYQSRKNNAFNSKKADMQKAFYGAAVESAGGESALESKIEPKAFSDRLAANVQKVEGISQQSGYSDAINGAVKATQASIGKASAKDLANVSSEALTNNWAKQNQGAFMSNYEQENPQKENESDSAYQTRKNTAFNSKKADMQKAFYGAAVESAGGESALESKIEPKAFSDRLAANVQKVEGVAQQSGYTDAINGAVKSSQASIGKAPAKDLATASSEALTNNWAKQNQGAFMSNYEQANPQQENESDSAYQTRKNTAFNSKKADMQKAFYGAAVTSAGGENALNTNIEPKAFSERLASNIQNVEGVSQPSSYTDAIKGAIPTARANGGKVIAKDLANTSAAALTGNWEKQNKESFMKDYATQNPQAPGESNVDFQQRSTDAFAAKKSSIQKAFYGAAVQSAGGSANLGNAIAPDEFSEKLNGNIQRVEGVGNEYQSAMTNAANNLSGMQMTSQKGQPNIPYLASGMANAAVKKQKKSYVADQIAQGVTPSSAASDWDNNHAMPAYQKAVETYNDSLSGISNVKSLNQASGPMGNIGQSVGRKISQGVAFTGAATGISGFAKGVTDLKEATVNGTTAVGTNMVSSIYNEDGNKLANGFKAVGPSLKAGHSEAIQTLADANGGAVNAQAAVSNNLGYGAAIVAGAGGYRAGKRMANKLSPYKSAVQESISSPSEVMQMAQTTTDDRGNTQIAPGAVRQVINPEESYIEVKTNSGENRVVSRKGAGHPGLRKGEAVYQDLQMQDDSLVVSKPKGSQTSSYRLDSGGGRIPSNVAVQQNPNSLLGTGQPNSRHSPISKQNVPLFNQNVDAGGFYVEDMAQAGMENVQVVVEKDRQYVTAQKEGKTFRVSPVYAGDSRLGTNESRTIPMQITNNKIKPNISKGSNVAVDSYVAGSDIPEDYYTSNSLGGMFPNNDYSQMIPNKQMERVRRTQQKRSNLDSVRRKQGILG